MQYLYYESLTEERQQKLNKDLLDRAYKSKTKIAFVRLFVLFTIFSSHIKRVIITINVRIDGRYLTSLTSIKPS